MTRKGSVPSLSNEPRLPRSKIGKGEPKIHLKDPDNGNGWCSAKTSSKLTTVWKEVNCKNCLRKKQDRKRSGYPVPYCD